MAIQGSTIPDAVRDFDNLPDQAFVSLGTLARIESTSLSTQWRRVAKGELPVIKLGPKTTRVNVGKYREIRATAAKAA